VSVLRGRPREGSGLRVGLGLTGLAAVVALALAPLLTPVERISGGSWDGENAGHLGSGPETVRGELSLRELEAQTGVPAEYVLRELGCRKRSRARSAWESCVANTASTWRCCGASSPTTAKRTEAATIDFGCT